MNPDKLKKWAELLLDTGKRNNLINFRDTKMGIVEIVCPDFISLFERAEKAETFEVYDPRIAEDDEEEIFEQVDELEEDDEEEKITKENYIQKYSKNIKRKNQILIYNKYVNPINALKNIKKKAKTTVEETGVNIAYIAFGFINWTESENSQIIMRAPLLLAPITIQNESSIEPFFVKVADDDIIVNPTFSFKMQIEHGIKIPDYDHEGIQQYLENVEQLFSKKKWSITKECKIGTFSFLKINMYKDIENNTEKILTNKNILSLLGENNDLTAIEEDYEIEKTIVNSLIELHNVVDADSSQLEAIELARGGCNFVLQGPPGTGKSQTITNIIAECLANDKKILFVSEKSAALNVVYDKLKKAGLEEFCLELHSHKANKKDFINELCETLKKNKSIVTGSAQKEVELKIKAQEDLDEYVEELHKVRPIINKSLYNLYEEVSGCRKAPDLEFVINNIKSKGSEHVNDAETVLNRFIEYSSTIGYDYHQNVWYGYVNPDTSYQTTIQLKSDLKTMVDLCTEIKNVSKNLKNKYSISIKNFNQAHALLNFFNLAKKSNFITPALLNSSTLINANNDVESMQKISKEIFEKKNIIDGKFDEEIYNLDGNKINKKLVKSFNGFLSRLFKKEYKKIIKEINFSTKDGKKVKYKEAVRYTNGLAIYQQKTDEFILLDEKNKHLFGLGYQGLITDFEVLLSELNILKEVLTSNIDFGLLFSLSLTDFLANQNTFSNISNELERCFFNRETSEKQMISYYDLEIYDICSTEINTLKNKFLGSIEQFDQLDNWREFNKLLSKLSELEVKAFVDFYIENQLLTKDIAQAYKKTFYMQWIYDIIHNSSILINLPRVEHDATVELFKQKDELNFSVNKAKIKAKLSAYRPDMNLIVPGGEVSTLIREGEKKRKQKGIRVLLDEIGELVQTLKPCFLMSPLSVSTFLNADMEFDVVIFDEASQIFPQDAIGAIYRGKQLIVVGDSKQMPPSNFFNSTLVQDDNDEDDERINDFESILDICSTTFTQKRLKWHYRSRYEQLISFSNKHFYGNELVTFPSSTKDKKGIGVDYYYVDGVFDRKSKTNRAEAEKIVDLVFENIEKYPNRTLGVVAFSISQQSLIDKLISKRREKDPSKEEFFRSDNREPFFVKNLETVQGDERDTIIFSIAYAKDSQGKLQLNFGPINREGGERRLNVAVTRAKENVQLVSSMHYFDIDLSRTQSLGTKLLYEYLYFAEKGENALERSISVNSFDHFDSEFEMEVCDFLRENGFEVDTQVGCSSFKIDLALKQSNSSNYVLAIECDGASYHSSKNARDRDRLRQEILERMGWKFYRIWSTDWFRNKRAEKERLLEAAKVALTNTSMIDKKKEILDDENSFEEELQINEFEFPEYEIIDIYELIGLCRYNLLLTIKEVVNKEGPISEKWLMSRMTFCFKREKVTSYVRDEWRFLSLKFKEKGIIKKNGFLYLEGKEIPMLRVPSEYDEPREIKNIAPEELALGMKGIIKQNIAIEKDSLFRSIAHLLGSNRRGDSINNHLETALQVIADEINIEGNKISLK